MFGMVSFAGAWRNGPCGFVEGSKTHLTKVEETLEYWTVFS